MKKPEALIVGINNFLGKAILKTIKSDYSVTGVYHQNADNIPEDVHAVQVDEIGSLSNRLFKIVYLISSYVPRENGSNHDERLVEANVILPLKVSKLFPDSRILLCSSVSVYENRNLETPIEIFEPPAPLSKYALSKLWSEQIVMQHRSYAIIRISSMYGVGMNTSTFLPKVIEKVLSTQEITLLGRGERLQNYIHVDDVAKIAIEAANQNNNCTVLAASSKSYSNKEIAEAILEIVPGNLEFSGLDNSKSSVYSNKFTMEMLGPLEFNNIKEGIKELVEWIKRKS